MNNIKENNAEWDNKNVVVDGEELKGNTLSTRISRLKSDIDSKRKNKEPIDDLELELNKLKGEEDRGLNTIDSRKRVQMDTGSGAKEGGNAFKNTHNKDGNATVRNTDAAEIGSVNKSGKRNSVTNQIKYDRAEVYESINEEINSVRYLIEYMNNNNKKII